MHVTAIQFLLIFLIAFLKGVDTNGSMLFNYMCVFPAWLVGIILGDPLTGLEVGATIQLMSLGVASIGGSSVPEYPVAAIAGTYIAIVTGQDQSVGVAIGVAVGVLCVQLDVVVKILNGFVDRRSEAFARQGEYGKMNSVLIIDWVLFGLSNSLPVLIVMLFGADAVNLVMNVMPGWFTTGLTIAGNMLPVIGIANLLNYMPTRKFASFLIVGYVLSAYLGLSIMPIALLGGAAAFEYYKFTQGRGAEPVDAKGALEDE